MADAPCPVYAAVPTGALHLERLVVDLRAALQRIVLILLNNMMLPILLAGLSALLLIWIVERLRTKRALDKLGLPATKVPSWPFGLDEIRTLLRTVKEGRLLDELLVRSQLYGHTYQMNILGTPLIVTDDPDNIRAVLATQFKAFGKGPQFHSMSKDFLGDSIFSTDGQPWHVARALLRPQFTKDRLSDLEVFEKHTQKLISHIGSKPIDVLDFFFRLTMDVTTEFLLGDSINSLNSLGDQTFPNAFMVCQEQLSTRARMGAAWRLAPNAKNYKKSIKILNDFFRPYIERVQNVDPKHLEQKSEKQYNFLEALAVENKDRNFLRDQMVAVLLAGRDTTGITLSWTFYYLAKNPDTYEKLRKVVLERIGSKRCPDANDLQEMKYVHHVLSEVLRLCPVCKSFSIIQKLTFSTCKYASSIAEYVSSKRRRTERRSAGSDCKRLSGLLFSFPSAASKGYFRTGCHYVQS